MRELPILFQYKPNHGQEQFYSIEILQQHLLILERDPATDANSMKRLMIIVLFTR